MGILADVWFPIVAAAVPGSRCSTASGLPLAIRVPLPLSTVRTEGLSELELRSRAFRTRGVICAFRRERVTTRACTVCRASIEFCAEIGSGASGDHSYRIRLRNEVLALLGGAGASREGEPVSTSKPCKDLANGYQSLFLIQHSSGGSGR